MQSTTLGRAMGAPIRWPAASKSGSEPAACAARTRSMPSPAKNAGSMSAVTALRSKC
ncbi:hypothetical protein [Asanoa siamensis]|uniref:hypothetical protein n=1 Tax=Asanoa siamensis TaxID=926357 RepID=UPI001EF35C34|nr:hypothetical protein [Asanoa siamensis]